MADHRRRRAELDLFGAIDLRKRFAYRGGVRRAKEQPAGGCGNVTQQKRVHFGRLHFGSSAIAGRIEHRAPLFAAIEQATRRFARDDLLAKLEAVGVPVGPINTVEQALNDPQVRARGMVVKGDRIDGLRTPIRFSDADLALGRPAPRLGERQDD